MLRWTGLSLVAFCATTWLLRAGAQTQETDWTVRVKDLERRVTALETRVVQLERGPAARTAVPPEKHAWRQLQRGMTTDQVRALLGEPQTVDANPTLTYWKYSSSGLLGPHVTFDSDSMKVSGWAEPK